MTFWSSSETNYLHSKSWIYFLHLGHSTGLLSDIFLMISSLKQSTWIWCQHSVLYSMYKF